MLSKQKNNAVRSRRAKEDAFTFIDPSIEASLPFEEPLYRLLIQQFQYFTRRNRYSGIPPRGSVD